MIPAVAAAIKRVEKLIEARPTTTLGASFAECQRYERDVLTPAVAERNRAVREAERSHHGVVAQSLATLAQDIADAQATHLAATENFEELLAEATAELQAATKPHSDPQIAAVMRTGNIRHAGEILAGKRQVEAATCRDQDIAAARRRHKQRIGVSL